MSVDPGSARPRPAASHTMAEQVGPQYYDTAGVTVILAAPGGQPIEVQAIEDRRTRHTLIALPAGDDWVYPTWQFRDHDVLTGLPEVLDAFHVPESARGARDDGTLRSEAVTSDRSQTRVEPWSPWSVAVWMTTALQDLGGVSVATWLLDGRDHHPVVQLARRTAAAWTA